MVLPTIVRLGAEFRPLDQLRVELAGTWEHWAEQESIRVTPKSVEARNVPGVGTVKATSVSLARNMRDTWAVALGGSYDLGKLFKRGRATSVLGGLMYESSAFSERALSPAGLDTNKVLLSLGASIEVARNVFIDASYGHMFMQNRDVRNSEVLLPAAIKPLPTDNTPGQYEAGDRPAIGNGKYVMEANFLGIGVRWKLDELKAKTTPAQAVSVSTPTQAEEPATAPAEPVSATPVEPVSAPVEEAPTPGEPAPEPAQTMDPAAAPAPAAEDATQATPPVPEAAPAPEGPAEAPAAPAPAEPAPPPATPAPEAPAPPAAAPAVPPAPPAAP